ncbi:enoyl-CoA hydratase/isomerase family protein [Limnohabitans sp. 2KL-3]|uniref:enoyl-CoA hydratase/isomerase family protein n=1 Tax=Limnohabitans sp. 2KL-3 TaxID=1100700 RepID=UPI000B7E7212|nr:enoyl-CoA hydratase-related protein [Limnohabitans sp. 2KL-3]
MTFANLLVHREHGMVWVTLHHPATRNALSPDMVAELSQTIAQAAQDSTVRAFVLRGSAGFFCAGGNVGNFQSRLQASAQDGEDPVVSRNRAFGHVLQALTALPMPVLAVVEGAAMGGGMGLACCADIVLATNDARFALSETGLGLIPAQIAPFVQARVGRRVALRLGLSGERVNGTLAQQLGLVDALAADSTALDALQAQWLNRILACGPQANRSLKALLSRDVAGGASVDHGLSAWLDDAALRFAQCMRSEGAEGIAAFRERRAPAWAQTLHAADVARLHGLSHEPQSDLHHALHHAPQPGPASAPK